MMLPGPRGDRERRNIGATAGVRSPGKVKHWSRNSAKNDRKTITFPSAAQLGRPAKCQRGRFFADKTGLAGRAFSR